ncbi:unnamed protein product [Clonostachys rosea]|uniref:Zn(2)-C6 fungal-type domain-containing protein n=1 Tax=Bionectria ochroleuca TaxID=29856 RepID=A0ABY6UY58_BIOOC|nr:unnamed protein product [Clonostachys rosea]
MRTNSASTGRGKSRAGCEQCKRRKVKCDEQRPACRRCIARGESCTGNFSFDAWQVERPWLSEDRGAVAVSALENDVLRYWYDNACLTMSLFRPPVNPLSHALSVWLRHSKALRHTLESVAEAHRGGFESDCLTTALHSRGLAISSLQNEVSRLHVSSAKQQMLLRTTLLSSLILCISAPWLDPSGHDFGIAFLTGSNNIIQSLANSHPTDPFAFYLLGLYLYTEAFCSYLVPADKALPSGSSLISIIQSPPYDSYTHPVTGIATTILPLLSDAGKFFRRVLETQTFCPSTYDSLADKLHSWSPSPNAPDQPQLRQLAEGYRSIGLIMLAQTKEASQGLSDEEYLSLLNEVLDVISTLKHLPKEDPLLNWVGPVIIIAGSELPREYEEERQVVEMTAERVSSWTRIHAYMRGGEVAREVWRLRDLGVYTNWLKLMMDQGVALAVW